MGERTRRLLAWAWALMLALSASPARAAFSPAWDSLTEKEALTLTVGGTVTEAAGLADTSLAAVNGWLDGACAFITLNADGGWRIRMAYRDADVMDVCCEKRGGGAVTVFSSTGRAYLTSEDQPDALALLTGTGDGIPDPIALAAAYPDCAKALFQALAEAVTAKTVKDKTSIQYALPPPVYESYAFPDGSLNDVWPRASRALLTAMKPALARWPQMGKSVEETLTALTFSGNCQIRRYLDADGNDMGVQFTGRAGVGEARKAFLTFGFTPGRGGSLALQWSTASGSFKLSAGGRLTAAQENGGELTYKGSLTRKEGKDEETLEWDVKLQNTIRAGTETWTGKAVCTRTVNKEKTVWTLIPALTLDGEGLSGTVEAQKKTGKRVTLKATLRLALAEDLPAAAGFETDRAVDLKGLDAEEARALAAAEMIPLAGAAARLMASLPQEVRSRLTHDLRTDAWMTGPSVGVLDTESSREETDEDSWVVEEEE